MPPKILKISGQAIDIERSLMLKNSNITSVMITAKQTKEALKNGKNEAVELDYDAVKDFVKNNKALLVGKTKHRIQINVLTEQGWRASHAFNTNENWEWFSRIDTYKEKEEIDHIFALQILIF